MKGHSLLLICEGTEGCFGAVVEENPVGNGLTRSCVNKVPTGRSWTPMTWARAEDKPDGFMHQCQTCSAQPITPSSAQVKQSASPPQEGSDFPFPGRSKK